MTMVVKLQPILRSASATRRCAWTSSASTALTSMWLLVSTENTLSCDTSTLAGVLPTLPAARAVVDDDEDEEDDEDEKVALDAAAAVAAGSPTLDFCSILASADATGGL
jgi:hypothetical protein